MKRALTACLFALLVGGAAAGCSSGSSSNASASSASTSSASASSASASIRAAALCTSVDALQRSVADLQNVQVVQNGVASLQDAFASVRTNVTQVVDDAQAHYSTQTDRLKADVSAVQAAIGQAQNAPSGADLNAVRTSIGTLADNVKALANDVSSTC
jgi:hypothetical protein